VGALQEYVQKLESRNEQLEHDNEQLELLIQKMEDAAKGDKVTGRYHIRNRTSRFFRKVVV
jgi:cell division protein FtsB